MMIYSFRRFFNSSAGILRYPVVNGILNKPLSDKSLANSKLNIEVTDRAIKRLRDLTDGGSNPEYLRVKIDSGGCHGYQYGFEMTTKKEDDDIIFKVDDVTLLMDSVSYPFLAGAEIDFVDELIGTSFKISKNPNAESECGCKISFQAKI